MKIVEIWYSYASHAFLVSHGPSVETTDYVSFHRAQTLYGSYAPVWEKFLAAKARPGEWVKTNF